MRRAAIPTEIITSIVHFAGLKTLDTSLSTVNTKGVHVHSSGSAVSSKDWIWTSPLDSAALARIAAVQVITISSDQGWASYPEHGSYSWFDIGLLRPSSDGNQEVCWRTSHHNQLAKKESVRREGSVITMEDKMWDNVKVGDVIAVRVCAQFGGWVNNAEFGQIKVWNWFEPVIPVSSRSLED
ncbi:hypothetical protein OF83DRAFT_755571 [Amylostereum chailletii]|nr:hypothetical protein OF83DRAFT_755571 [Amylostereum chailletii]